MKFFTTLSTFIYILLFNIFTSYVIHENSDDDLFLTLYGTPKCRDKKKEELVTIELRNNYNTVLRKRNVKCGTPFNIFMERFSKTTLLEDISVRFIYNNDPKKFVFKHIVSDCTHDFDGEGYDKVDNDISCTLENIE